MCLLKKKVEDLKPCKLFLVSRSIIHGQAILCFNHIIYLIVFSLLFVLKSMMQRSALPHCWIYYNMFYAVVLCMFFHSPSLLTTWCVTTLTWAWDGANTNDRKAWSHWIPRTMAKTSKLWQASYCTTIGVWRRRRRDK